MRISEILRTYREAISELGIREIVTYAPEYLSELIRHRLDRFDSRYGTETNSAVPVSDLDGIGSYLSSAELYWPIRESAFKKMMTSLNKPFSDRLFMDLGSGKGRALLLASQLPFTKIIGVEFSPKLCDIAKRNIEKMQAIDPNITNIEVICQDASALRFPKENMVLFLFDPFGPEVMGRVIDNLVESLRVDPRECHVAYCLPMHQEMFEHAGFRTVAKQSRSWKLTYPWTIFSWQG